MHRFYCPEMAAGGLAGLVALDEVEAHHARSVVRVAVGDAVRVFDGRGQEWAGSVAAVEKRRVQVTLSHAVEAAREPAVHITLAVGRLKGDQMDTVVRDATMLGVAAIVPIEGEHTAVSRRRTDARERWLRVAVASAKQCGRAVVPRVDSAATVTELLARAPAARDARHSIVMAVEPARGGAVVDGATLGGRPLAALVLVGPEGGWSTAEVDLAVARGAALVQLGPRTLRAEAAPAVVLASLWTVWGW
jgi:16S rRNA (uracil1498-N3)-methyltransferase